MNATFTRTLDEPSDTFTYGIVFEQTDYNVAFERAFPTSDEEARINKLYADIQRDTFGKLPKSMQLRLLAQFAEEVEKGSATTFGASADAPQEQ